MSTRARAALAVVVALLAVRLLAPLLFGGALLDAAAGRPGLISTPVIGDMIVEALGDRLRTPAGTDSQTTRVTIAPGSSTADIAGQLYDAGLIADEFAFIVAVRHAGLEGLLQAGDFLLAPSMTPGEVAQALIEPYREPTIAFDIRAGLRMEQIVAKIDTVDLPFSGSEVLQIFRDPPAELLADYPWLDIPEGGTLEGRLAAGTYSVPVSATAEDFVRLLLDGFAAQVPEALRTASASGLSFAEVLSLASVVEKEAALDEERARVAGVFAYRMQRGMGLESDVTLIYMLDSAALRKRDVSTWGGYAFWTIPSGLYARADAPSVPRDLQRWNSRKYRGVPPAPICTPSRASIEAALNPDTSRRELYFIAIPNGGGKTDFSTTYAEHMRKVRMYGFNP
ncbi:MAG: hypothetical protein RLZZ432_629 [Chloroflexota bacterium]